MNGADVGLEAKVVRNLYSSMGEGRVRLFPYTTAIGDNGLLCECVLMWEFSVIGTVLDNC